MCFFFVLITVIWSISFCFVKKKISFCEPSIQVNVAKHYGNSHHHSDSDSLFTKFYKEVSQKR